MAKSMGRLVFCGCEKCGCVELKHSHSQKNLVKEMDVRLFM